MVLKEEIEQVFNDLILSEKCSKPSYIQALPYDLMISDLDKLQERLDKIDEEVSELDELIGTELWIQQDRQDEIDRLSAENNDLTKIQEQLVKDNQQTTESENKLMNEGFDSVEKIKSHFTEELGDYPIGHAMMDGKPNLVYSEIMSLSEMFENGGLITSNQAEALNNLADKIIDYRYTIENEDTAWAKRVDGIADDLRFLAEKHNVNKNSLGDDLEDFQQNYNFIMQHAQTKNENIKQIDDANLNINESIKIQKGHEKVKQDYLDERERTQLRIDGIKKGKIINNS